MSWNKQDDLRPERHKRSGSMSGFLVRIVLGVGVTAASLCLLLDFVLLPRWLRASGAGALARDDLLGTLVRQAWIHDACLLLFVVSVLAWVAVRTGRRLSAGFSNASRSLSAPRPGDGPSDRLLEDLSEPRELIETARRLGRDLNRMRHALDEERARTRQLLDEQTEGLRHALRRLADKDRLRDSFVERVSHEFRTPLASIRSFAEILRRYGQSEDPATVEEFLTIIQRESDRLARLIGDFLDLSNIENGRVAWRLVPVDVGWVVRECAQACRGLYEARKEQLEIDPGVGIPRVRADRDRLAQAVTNLLATAVERTDPGGTVRVSVTKQVGGQVAVAVEHSGPPLDAEQCSLLLESGDVVSEPTSLADNRLNLGLAIVREIVLVLGGKVSVQPSALGGSCVVFTCHAWAEADGALPREGRPPTALVVAGEAASRLGLRQSLAPAGFLTAEVTPDEAEFRAEAIGPDLVVLDLLTEEISPWQVLEAVRGRTRVGRVPVLLVALEPCDGKPICHAAEAFIAEAERGGELLQLIDQIEERDARALDRVLLASRVVSSRHVMASVLRHSGRTVVEVADGNRAHEELRKGTDLLVIDTCLPAKTVAGLVRASRAEGRSVRVMLVATQLDPAQRETLWPVMALRQEWPSHPLAARAAAALTALVRTTEDVMVPVLEGESSPAPA